MKNSNLTSRKTVLLISDVAVWGDTPAKRVEVSLQDFGPSLDVEESRRVIKDEPSVIETVEKTETEAIEEVKTPEIPKKYRLLPFEESDYQLRKSYPKYESWKNLENLVLSLNDKENIRGYVICSGVLYGQGESVLAQHFLSAWLGEPSAIPYLPPGDNLVPTIHIVDLARLVKFVIENMPINSYILAVDNTKDKTQKNLVQAISQGIGNGSIESVGYEDAVFED